MLFQFKPASVRGDPSHEMVRSRRSRLAAKLTLSWSGFMNEIDSTSQSWFYLETRPVMTREALLFLQTSLARDSSESWTCCRYSLRTSIDPMDHGFNPLASIIDVTRLYHYHYPVPLTEGGSTYSRQYEFSGSFELRNCIYGYLESARVKTQMFQTIPARLL